MSQDVSTPPDARQLAALVASVTQDLASSLDPTATLRHVLSSVVSYMHAEAGSIFLVEGEGAAAELVCRACQGPVDVKGLRLRPDAGIVGQTVQSSATRVVRDVAEDPNFSAVVDADTGFCTRSLLCAPLVVQGRCIGAVELINKRSREGLFDAADEALATALAASAALAIHSARMAQELIVQERMCRELELAREIQSGLLPPAHTPGLPVYGCNRPATEVSGDFFDCRLLPDGRVYFAIADVAGKGMNAALLMSRTSSLLRCLAREATDPAQLLADVNRELCETGRLGFFVTAICGFHDPVSGEVRLANAGHLPALWIQAGQPVRSFAASGLPLGIEASAGYETEIFTAQAGDLYLYTDGLTEARDAAGEEFGQARLTETVLALAGFAGNKLVQLEAALTAGGFTARDDLTLLQVEFSKAFCDDESVPDVDPETAGQALLALAFRSNPAALAPMRAALRQTLEGVGLIHQACEDIVLAVNEACANVIRHAYGPSMDGPLRLAVFATGGEVRVVVDDWAPPVDFCHIRPRDLDDVQPGGIGTHFMQALVDSCEYAHRTGGVGNRLILRRRFAALTPAGEPSER